MARFNKTLKTIMEAMNTSSKEKTKAYDTPATVLRVDGDTLWVHIDGGVDETPIKRTIDAKVGDVVQVRVGGGRAWATGNASAPPTDDTKAGIALEQTNAVSKAVKTVKTLVDKVTKIAGDTAQYFWHTQQGTDTGVHITEIPKEDFLADPENGGGNLLARSNGIAVRDGLTELAQFGAEGINIGFSTGNHVTIDSESIDIGDGRGLGSTFLRMIKKGIQLKAKPDISTGSVTTPFEVSYRFRDISEVRDYVGMPVTTTSQSYTLRYTPRSDIVVRIGTNISGFYESATFSYGSAETKTVTYHSGVTTYRNIITYDGDDTFTYSTDTYGGFFYDVAYETGTGNANTGATMSLGTHEGVTVYKKGRETTRLGGGLIAESDYQTIIGKCNNNKSENIFEVGNGASYSSRSNAFEVGWNGKVTANGYTIDKTVSGTTHAAALKSWFNDENNVIVRNSLIPVYSSAYSNGSVCLGYFLEGYDTNPYGGFFVCNYNYPRYVGIQGGTFTQYEITKTATSSRKTKENIKPMSEEEAKKLYDLNIISFDYKKEYEDGKKNQFGLIAEDCDEVIPYAVYKPDDSEDSIWGIDYVKFVPYLIKNLQLHEQKINELEKEIEFLKCELNKR